MEPVTAADTPDLRNYIRVLRKRKWTIVLVTLLVGGLTLLSSYFRRPVYEASAEVLVTSPVQAFASEGATVVSIENEAELMASVPVARRVIEELGLEASPDELLESLTAAPLGNETQVLVVSYYAHHPALARSVANSFAENYLAYREELLLSQIEEAVARLEARIEDTIAQYDEVTEQLVAARAAGDTSRTASLVAERSLLEGRLQVLEQNLNEIETVRPTGRIGQILNAADTPEDPLFPNRPMDAALGVAVGLLLGVGAAFFREKLDQRFKGRMEVALTLGAPILAMIPKVRISRKKKGLVVLNDPDSMASESFRSLRANVQSIAADQGIKSILVTSSSASEGKTLTSANLALALAEAGQRVVLVSADLRRPSFERLFGLNGKAGFSTWLVAKVEHFRPPLIPLPDEPKLRVLLSGSGGKNPAGLLASPRLPRLLRELENEADFVILDSPPVLPVADALILSEFVGGTILVVNPGRSHRGAALHARQSLEGVNATIIGVVINAYDAGPGEYEYPYHYLRYRPERLGSKPNRPKRQGAARHS